MSRKTRGDGEGSVYWQDGSWRAQMYERDPETGKRRPRRIRAGSKSEAVRQLREMQRRQQAAAPLVDSTATLAVWSVRWEEGPLAVSNRRETTRATYSALLASTIRPHLGRLTLAEVTPSEVERWLATLDGRGYSASTRRQSLTVLRACLDAAVRDGLVATNPAANVARPVVRRTEAHVYTPGQVRTILDTADGHRLRPLLVVLAGTGLRRGEALALHWSHVDLDRGELRVRGTLVRTSDGLTVNEPKTRHGWRTVPLPGPVVEVLREQQTGQKRDRLAAGPSWIPGPFVFTTEAGTPLDPRNVSRWFSTIVEETGVGGSLHTLRHTALSGMANAGVPLSVVPRLAGHESISTTVDLYGHVSDDAARDAMNRGASVLGL